MDQAARRAIPIWLQGANVALTGPSDIPPHFVEVLRPYTLDFVIKGIAEVVCLECQEVGASVSRTAVHNDSVPIWSRCTSEWHCPMGHLLYHQYLEIHWCR